MRPTSGTPNFSRRFVEVAWPARPSDLNNAWEIRLWVYLNSLGFVRKPDTIAELKNCNRNETAATPMSLISRVLDTFVKYIKLACGGNLSDHIYSTNRIAIPLYMFGLFIQFTNGIH